MKGTYIAVAIMTAVVIAAIGYGFFSAGSPWAVRGYKLDATRMTDFSEIQSAMQEYYDGKYQLPATLGDLESSTYGSYYVTQNVFTDPSIQQVYDYKTTGQLSYQLCATFAASSQEESQYNGDSYEYLGSADTPTTHTQGYDCLSYSVTGTASPQPEVPSPLPYEGTYYPNNSAGTTTSTASTTGGAAQP